MKIDFYEKRQAFSLKMFAFCFHLENCVILSFFLIDKKCYFLYNMNVNFYNKVIILKKGKIKALCLKTLKDCSLQHSC